jgi:ABC-type dipeptide/oligopeptide/nickel transport system permease subunit
MKLVRVAAALFIPIIIIAAVLGPALYRVDYAVQYRELPDSAPVAGHILGTDELGRDRLARLLVGLRISLLLAPMASLATVVIAALAGGVAGYCGGWVERFVLGGTDLALSVPWLFLLITVRAGLPLDVSPYISVGVTFLLLGALGWPAAARVVAANVKSMRRSEFMLLARAAGVPPWRAVLVHMLPNVREVLLAQFAICVPLFVIAEANLGALGLGVVEPLPSLGSLLRDLQASIYLHHEFYRFIPMLVLIAVVMCLQPFLKKSDAWQ